MEIEIFESIAETTRGERTVEDSEARLQLFVDRVTSQVLSNPPKKWKLNNGPMALKTFLQLNRFILNLKKVRTFSFTLWFTTHFFGSITVPLRYSRSDAQDPQETRKTHGVARPSYNFRPGP
jgi:hypothetical protein